MIQKKYLTIFFICTLVIGFIFSSRVYATLGDKSWNELTGGDANTKVTEATYKIWNTVKIVMQVLAIAGVMFAGVSIMFSSADQKADAKKKLGFVLFGSILVFATSIVIDIILKVVSDTL